MKPEAPAAAAHPGFQGRHVARPLAPVALALMAGMAAPAWGLKVPDGWLAGALVFLWAALALIRLAGRPARFLPLTFFWLLGVGLCQQALQPVWPPHHLAQLGREGEVVLAGRLNRPGKVGEGRNQLFVKAAARRRPQGWQPAAGNLLVSGPGLAIPPVGTEVVVRGRPGAPRVLRNPGAFDRARYLAADGIFREIRLQDRDRLVFLASSGSYPLGEKLRGGIRQRLRDLSPAMRAIFLAMLLGDQGEITPEMRRQFAMTGTSHLLVINGLHLGMVAAVTYFLSFWALRRFPWLLLRINVVQAATLIAVFPVVAYAWVAGGSPSTQRAEVMVLAYLLLVFLGRPREVWSALALAALVILTLAPLRLFAISFQLSFAAVAGLVYFVKGREDEEEPASTLINKFWLGVKKFWLGVKVWMAISAGTKWLLVSVVATFATAPLVALYFQVVSVLGILVNLAAIPLVLGLALPLGEAAVLAQALSLTPVSNFFLALGQAPLWLGWQLITWAAALPGAAVTVPMPTWAQIAACYALLICLGAPRRGYLTWSGAALAGVFLAASVAWPLMWQPRCLEVTCLDSRGLDGVAVSPEGRRLVFSAAAPSWPGRPGGGPGPLPSYCHWRQFRRLDLAAALTLSQDNAGEMLALVRQFQVGGCWFGRRGREGPANWDLWNYLGDRGAAPRSLERGRPPESLGSVRLEFLRLGRDQGLALQLTWEGRRGLLIPPVRNLAAADLPGGAGPRPDLLVLPAPAAGSRDEVLAVLDRLRPGLLVLYGGQEDPGLSPHLAGIPWHRTRHGAVSVYLSADETRVKQW